MSDARSAILARLRAGDEPESPPFSDMSVMMETQRTPEERLARFSDLMRKNNAKIHFTTEADWPQVVVGALDDRGLDELLIGDSNVLMDRLQKAGLGDKLKSFDHATRLGNDGVFAASASLTSVRAGIAETGSLVLWPNGAEPRQLSLVPPLHIALLKADSICDTLWHLMNSEYWAQGMPTNALLISGPSKTADIEQHLTFGVHGPKELIVLVVLD